MPKKLLLVDDDDLMRKMMNSLLVRQGFDVIAVENGPKALEQLKFSTFDTILLDVMMPEMDGFEVCRTIRSNPTTARIPIIMLTALDSVENKVKGFEAGADDYLSKPCDIAELVARINVMIRRTEAVSPPVTKLVTTLEREAARTIAIFSLRGGSGVSTIAVNLAAGLSQLWEMQVALVDMVSVAGQTALFLNQSLRNTWADVCIMEVIDEEAVLSAMLPHESRVRTLASPRRPEESELLTPGKVKTTLEILRATFPYVVLDMPHDLSERSLTALDLSDIILIITQPEIASLRAATMAVEIFKSLKYDEQKKIYIILNWTFPRHGLAVKDIERMLKSKIDLILPYAADEFINALNVGNPPILSDPEGSLGTIFEDIALALSKDSQKKERPDQPSLTWKRVAQRIRKKKQESPVGTK
jgi:pilus assembly protein CpaE